MLRSTEILGIALVAGVATLGLATAEARDVKVQKRAEPVATPAERAEVGQAAAEQIVQIPGCARKVKVVYAGYGEGSRAGCQETSGTAQ